MNAFEKGLKRGTTYMQRFSVERLATMPLKEFCSMGRLDAKQHYTTEKALNDYARGWFAVGNNFTSLFKPDDEEQMVAEREIKLIWDLLERADEKLQKLMTWRKDNMLLATNLQHARDEIEEAQCDIQDVVAYLKKAQKEQK